MLIDKNNYKASLCDLWHRVFGDEYSFIELIFKEEYKKNIICFAEIVDGKAVSAFYLIKNSLRFDGKCFNGYYLYAAATLPEYRKSGLMSKLICEAKTYCKNKGADYISLVPSSDSLYCYYSRFGFCEAMYRVNSSGYRHHGAAEPMKETVVGTNELRKIRAAYEGNIMLAEDESLSYMLNVLEACGAAVYKLSDSGCFIFSDEDKCILEFISSEEDLISNSAYLEKVIPENVTVSSPFALPFFSENKKVRFGMLCPLAEELQRSWSYADIYMNLALD